MALSTAFLRFDVETSSLGAALTIAILCVIYFYQCCPGERIGRWYGPADHYNLARRCTFPGDVCDLTKEGPYISLSTPLPQGSKAPARSSAIAREVQSHAKTSVARRF